MMEEELRQVLEEQGWSLYKRIKKGRAYFYALKWKRDQVYIASESKLATTTKEEVLKKISSA